MPVVRVFPDHSATIGQGEGIVDVGAALCIAFEAGCEFRTLSGPPVDIAAFADDYGSPYHSDKDYLMYGPPRLLAYLQALLRG